MFVKKNMTHLVLDIKKESDLQALLPLLKRLKIRFSKTVLPFGGVAEIRKIAARL